MLAKSELRAGHVRQARFEIGSVRGKYDVQKVVEAVVAERGSAHVHPTRHSRHDCHGSPLAGTRGLLGWAAGGWCRSMEPPSPRLLPVFSGVFCFSTLV